MPAQIIGFQLRRRDISATIAVGALILTCGHLLRIGGIETFSNAALAANRPDGNAGQDSQKPPLSKKLALSVPDGFVVEEVAGGLGVQFPMFGAFSDDGRLFVAESSGLDLHVELKTGARNSRISVLDDADGDGRFDSRRVFADKLVCPMGLAWRDGKLYVADPPDVVVFTDEDADGKADSRRVILSGFGHSTNGSLHGLVFGPDGMLYMTMGSPDGYSLKSQDGSVLSGDSGALIRCRPDGGNPEVLCRGFVNLIEVAFTARGDIIGTDNWYQKPDDGLRDALVHLVDGGLYPYLVDTGTRYPITGVSLPPVALYPAVAVSGITCYRGPSFPADMNGNLFTAQFNARKVVRHSLSPHSSTFRAVDEDFVTTEDPDFHPSDIVESADGSLLVIDTGSWYVEHCPTGRIREVHAPGGIYRVRFAPARAVDDPWGQRIAMDRLSAAHLAALLSDSRPVVRERAQRALSSKGSAAVKELASVLERSKSTTARQHAIWALAAISHKSALRPLRDAVRSGNADIVVPAVRAIGLRRDVESSALLEQLLTRGPSIRLAAAEALARAGSGSALANLWVALASESDPFLEHAVIHAAYRLATAADLQRAIRHPNPVVVKAALLLLDQPPRPPGSLRHTDVVERLSDSHSELRRAAREILARHPEWAPHAVGFLRNLLVQEPLSKEDRAGLSDLIAAFQENVEIQELVAAAIQNDDGKVPADNRVRLIDMISRTTLPEIPRSWISALSGALNGNTAVVRLAAVRCAAVLQFSALDEQLDRLANSPDEPKELRREALRAIVARRARLGSETFGLLMDDLSGDSDPLLRLGAAELLGAARLDGEQVKSVLRSVEGDGLVTPASLLPMLKRSATRDTAPELVKYFEASVRAGWRPPAKLLDDFAHAFRDDDLARMQSVLQGSQESAEELQSRLAQFLPLLEGGDAERGRTVFQSKRTACSTCHRVGNDGGQIGPDLTRIASIRAGRDLVESIVMPGSTIAQEFEQYMAVTTAGRVINGIMARESTDSIVLRDSSGAQTRIPRNEIDELRRAQTSMMPEGLAQMLSPEEFRDLLAYLQALK